MYEPTVAGAVAVSEAAPFAFVVALSSTLLKVNVIVAPLTALPAAVLSVAERH